MQTKFLNLLNNIYIFLTALLFAILNIFGQKMQLSDTKNQNDIWNCVPKMLHNIPMTVYKINHSRKRLDRIFYNNQLITVDILKNLIKKVVYTSEGYIMFETPIPMEWNVAQEIISRYNVTSYKALAGYGGEFHIIKYEGSKLEHDGSNIVDIETCKYFIHRM